MVNKHRVRVRPCRIRTRELLGESMLKKAYLEITNVCNLSCSFCPGTRREKRFMTPEDFETLSRKLRGHVEYLYLHLMGEPLLHPQLEEILGIAARQGFRVIITTNGTLLDRRGELLVSSPAVYKVNISLQSFEATEPLNRTAMSGCARTLRRRCPRRGSSVCCASGTKTGSTA